MIYVILEEACTSRSLCDAKFQHHVIWMYLGDSLYLRCFCLLQLSFKQLICTNFHRLFCPDHISEVVAELSSILTKKHTPIPTGIVAAAASQFPIAGATE
jgi:hypothetical protein